MWIEGRRRGGSKDLATHLQKTDENESVAVLELSGFSLSEMTGNNLEKAIRQMEAIGYGKGTKRNLFHVILAPAYGETLNVEQRKQMVDYYAQQMGFVGHQYALVEHWKKGKQHFHLVFNIVDPATGKNHELKWTKRKEWQISRDLEQQLGLKAFAPKGKAAKVAEMQRGKRTGIDPRKIRKDVTAIYHTSMTAGDFVGLLEKSGYAMTRGRNNQLVLVDKFGDTHGLMRMIEGKKLGDLRRKFPELSKMTFHSHDQLVSERKKANPTKSKTQVKPRRAKTSRRFIPPRLVRRHALKSYNSSKIGSDFCQSLSKRGYRIGQSTKGLVLIDKYGGRHNFIHLLGKDRAHGLQSKFPDLASLRFLPASTIIRNLKSAHRSKKGGLGRRLSSGRGGSVLHHGDPVYLKALFHRAAWGTKYRREQEQKQQSMAMRPMAHGGMCEAQRIDLEAAIAGKITWAEYFQKWGGGQPAP